MHIEVLCARGRERHILWLGETKAGIVIGALMTPRRQRSWDAPGWNSWKVRHSRAADEASWGTPDGDTKATIVWRCAWAEGNKGNHRGALRAEGCCELLPSGGCWGLAATSYLRWCRHGGARSLASPTSWGCQCQATGSPFGCLICPTQRVAPCPQCKGCVAATDGGGGWSRPDGACKPERQRGWPDTSFEVRVG